MLSGEMFAAAAESLQAKPCAMRSTSDRSAEGARCALEVSVGAPWPLSRLPSRRSMHTRLDTPQRSQPTEAPRDHRRRPTCRSAEMLTNCTIAREWEGEQVVYRLSGVFDRDSAWALRQQVESD